MNSWHVQEACKTFSRMGAYNGLSLDEQFALTRTWCRSIGATEEVIAEGWQEYQLARSA